MSTGGVPSYDTSREVYFLLKFKSVRANLRVTHLTEAGKTIGSFIKTSGFEGEKGLK